MKNIKILALSLIIGSSLILGSAAVTTSAATWEDTGWIQNGVSISGTRIKRHLDYLREQVSSMVTQVNNLSTQISNISSGLWSKNGSSAYYNSGNVGIGTASPAQKLHTTGNVRADGGTFLFGATQYLYGDNSSALYYNSNNSTDTQLIMRDAENTIYGRLFGSGDGRYFGLLDGDGHWSYLADKDNATHFYINNTTELSIYPTYISARGNNITNVGTPTSASDAATKGYVDSNSGASLGSSYYAYGWFGAYTNCASGYVMTGSCGAGFRPDCSGNAIRIKCTQLR